MTRTNPLWRIALLMAALVAATVGVSIGDASGTVLGAPGDVGFQGPPYVNNAGAPSGEKPESKLWWNDGIWWASLWADDAREHHIFRLDLAARQWVDTGVELDPRRGTKADVLWDGTKLYVASHGFTHSEQAGYPARLYRFSYHSATRTYSLDSGFPTKINDWRTETLVIDKDSTGQLWATWTQPDSSCGCSRVMYNRTVGSDAVWGTPAVLPISGVPAAAGELDGDDISALVPFGDGKIGVMWSNQDQDAMYFATHDDTHPDGTWLATRTALGGPNFADDHINLKSLRSGSDGRVFAAVKSSQSDADPSIRLLVHDPANGNWTAHVFGRGSDKHTRPIVVLDTSGQRIHMLATADENGGTIYRKTTSWNSISFETGRGEPFIQEGATPGTSGDLNNPTSTKQTVNSTTGLVVLATNDTADRYWWNYDPLGGTSPPGDVAPTWSDATIGHLQAGEAFTDRVQANGVPTPTYSVTDGALPSGLSLNATTGAITGVPTTAGAFSFTITASNGVAPAATVVLSGDVEPADAAPTWTDSTIGDLRVGVSFSDRVAVAGHPASTFAVSAGVVPEGLTLNGSTGEIKGVPTVAGPYSFTITASNGVGAPITTTLSGVINPATVPATATFGLPTASGDVPAGSSVDVALEGIAPDSEVEIDLDGVVLVRPRVDANGALTTAVTLPTELAPGPHTLTVRGRSMLGDQFAEHVSFTTTTTNSEAPVTTTGNGFNAIEPMRVLDTREGRSKPAAESEYVLTVDEGWHVDDAISVVVTVTVTDAEGEGFVTVHPCGTDRPLASTVNYESNRTVANVAVVAATDAICLYTHASAHLVVDLNGYHTPHADARLHPVPPHRVLDTRDTAPITGGQVAQIDVIADGIAPAGSTAVVLNATITNAVDAGHVTVYPCGTPRPVASSVNYRPGDTIAGQVFAKVGDDGTVCIYLHGTADLVVDVAAAFAHTTTHSFTARSPVRVLDTRTATTPSAGDTVILDVDELGLGGAAAVALNVAAVNPSRPGHVTVHPCAVEPPLASNVNFAAAPAIANHVTAAVSPTGTVCLYVSSAIDLVIDLQGHYR